MQFCTNQTIIFFSNDLLTAAAKMLGCKFVFTPELSADIASQMLTSVSLGRGLHIAFDAVSFHTDINVIVVLINF